MVCVCMHVCVSECVHPCMCAHALNREVSRIFASTTLAVVWMAMYLTDYSDYLTSLREPPLPPYRYHTGSKICRVITDNDIS